MIRALVIFNRDYPDEPEEPPDSDPGREARADVENVAREVAAALARRGARVVVHAVSHPAEVVRATRQFSSDLVFNLCESFGRDARYEPTVAALIERLDLPFTGSDARALRLCLDKFACNNALVRAAVPVPASTLLGAGEGIPPGWAFPIIVKPNREDGSTGIHSGSVVTCEDDLRSECARLRGLFGAPPLVQRYIAGREVTVSLLGGRQMRVLPMGEIDFGDMPSSLPRIVSYASKWSPGTPEWNGTKAIDAILEPALERRLAQVARAVAAALGLWGYARIDVRVDGLGRPFVVDVNPNCDLAPDAGLAKAARRAGVDYDELVWGIVEAALERHPAARLERARSAPRLAGRRRAPSMLAAALSVAPPG